MTVTDISTYEVIEPQDQRYDAARAVWNGAIDHRPAPIARPRTDAEVTDALMRARDDGAEIAVRGGGHSMIFSGCRLNRARLPRAVHSAFRTLLCERRD
jgi:FAD/FMN-containing dehydrogenase